MPPPPQHFIVLSDRNLVLRKLCNAFALLFPLKALSFRMLLIQSKPDFHYILLPRSYAKEEERLKPPLKLKKTLMPLGCLDQFLLELKQG